MKKKKLTAIFIAAVLLVSSVFQTGLTVLAAEFEPLTESAVQVPSEPESSDESESQIEPEIYTEPETYAEPAVQAGPVSLEEPIVPIEENPDPSMDEWVETARAVLAEIAQERDIMALVYLSDEYPIRVSPSYESETVVTVLSGHLVNILDVQVSEDGIWEYVRLEYDSEVFYGYVPRTNLACSDSRFLDWELEYGMYPNMPQTMAAAGEIEYADVQAFPESYRPALLELKKAHPNWTFVVMNTGLDWNNAIYNEMQGGKSLVHRSMSEWMKNGLYDQGSWYFATEQALKLYMDPRNHLAENAIFQFEQLTYNANYHTIAAVETFLNSTFMKSGQNAPASDKSYAEIFWNVGLERNVSPFHLAARVLQEQGSGGTSPLISGAYPGYEGYYNYFNVNASGTTNEEIYGNGLKYALEHGWNSAETSIAGGASVISANYIQRGQDTLYLQKFNVNPNGYYAPYTHQYMQNISAPTTEASSIKRLYEQAGSLNSAFVFKIPIYENMPAEVCGIPAASTEIALALPAGYTDTVVWLDGVAYQGIMQGGSLTVTAPDTNAKSAVVYQYDASGVPVNMYVWSLRYNELFYVVTPEPQLENLLSYHGFSIRITGKSGIRCKTGISADLRGQLIGGQVNGFTLKEYGTLIMSDANRSTYPMIKGGEKVASGMAYGLDGNGQLQDVVFETVDGSYRYTAVLVGLPVEQYKTEFAFRGYAVLEKNGQQTVIYGPVVARSIYNLAGRFLAGGSYAPDSSAYVFLQQLISDADALGQ